MDDPLIGSSLGHFQIEELIAEGGMGLIYRATHNVIGKQAAVKVLSARYSSDKNMIKRLHREARAVNRIGHPNIIDIFDFGQTADGREYFVMEYVPGSNLAEVIIDKGPVPWTFVRQVMSQTLDALAAIHDLGFIHRDIKPENLLVGEQDMGRLWVKLLDFGIVRSVNLGPDGERLTRAGSVMGTPEYVAPEQIRGRETDGRVDLYAMGIMLFEMITGRRPFESEKMISLLMAHLRDPVPPLDDIPPELEIPDFVPEVIHKAMAKNPDQRYQSAREMAQALRIDITTSGTPSGIHPPLTDELREAIREQLRHSVPPGQLNAADVPGTGQPSLHGGALPTTSGMVRQPSTTALNTGKLVRFQIIIPIVLLLASAVAIGVFFAVRSTTDNRFVADAADASIKTGPRDPNQLDLPTLYQQVRRVLRKGAQNPRAEIRQLCIKGIGELKDREAAPFLYASLREDPDRAVQAATALAIAEVADKAAVPHLQTARSRSDAVTRVYIDDALMRLSVDAGRTGLLDATRADEREARFQAALALGEAGDTAALPALASLARQAATLNTQTVVALLGTLSRLGHKSSFVSLKKAMSSPDPVASLGAAEALARLGDDEALRVLRKVVAGSDRSAALVAAKILGSLGDYSGLKVLLVGIEASDQQTRVLAADGLGSISDKSALPPLAKALDDTQWVVKAAAAEALARILAQMPSALVQRSQDWIKTALASRNWSVRHTAVDLSSEMDPELAVSLIGWALQDKDIRVRRAAVASLDKLQSPKALKLLTHALTDKSEDVRRAAADALSRAGGTRTSKTTKDLLHNVVQDRSAPVGVAAAGALVAAGDETYVPDLIRAAKKGSPAVRREALNSLGKWKKPQAVKLLREALNDKDATVRYEAARQLALRKQNAPGVELNLRRAVNAGGPNQKPALAALESLGVKTAPMVKKLGKSRRRDDRRTAMEAAANLPAGDRIALLRKGVEDRNAGVRLAAAGTLGELAADSPEAAALLRTLRRDKSAAVRTRTAIGLAKLHKTHKAPDMGKVKPVAPAPLPRAKAPKPRPKPRAGGRPLFVEDTSKSRSYKYHLSQGAIATSQGRYKKAVRHLRAAAATSNQPTVLFELGDVYLRLALQSRSSQPTTARKYLILSRRYFGQYLRKSPSGKQAGNAKRGLEEAGSLLKQLKAGR